MKLGFDLKLEQSQKLIMTPELRQAIELLQLNTIELNQYISKELEENPMLESSDSQESLESLDQHSKEDEIDWSEYFEKSNSYEYKSEIDRNIEQVNFESFITYEQNLNEYLFTQLNLLKIDEKEKKIGSYILENLDEDGYLTKSVAQISSELKVGEKEVESVLSQVQKFDPKGIASRSLEECLLNQIEDQDGKLSQLIKGHLEDVAYNRIEKIGKSLDINQDQVLAYIRQVQGLEPKPGRYLADNTCDIRYISPDAEIILVDGQFKVVLNEATGPRLNINNFYKAMIKSSQDQEAKNFLNERLNRALWVIQSIEQRRNTIKKVIESLVKFQTEFLLEGEKFLRPMTMKEVAEDIDMHESTVSRATTGKYVQTPQGIFELKYFFTTGLLGINGDVSSTAIKSSIKDLIENENPKKPLSDQKISDILKESGTRISRRTVAKYRTELDILSSAMRKR